MKRRLGPESRVSRMPRIAGRYGALALLALSDCFGPEASRAEALPPAAGYELVAALTTEDGADRRRAAARLSAARDESLLPALVDTLFFTPSQHRSELFGVLEALTGEQFSSYRSWVEYLGGRSDLEPKEGYDEFKGRLFSRIDPRYERIFYAGAPARIRLEEVIWGGVPVDGIPALDSPPTLPAGKAKYLGPRERVFGVVIEGRARAYPLRILDWHELLNDRIGDQPVALSYCTLCGSGILYATQKPAGGAYRFGTSGLLYRSNKLMFDQQTMTLWSNLTGEPVVGRLAASPVRLPVLPLTLTTWEEWRTLHPDTDVLDLERIRQAARGRYSFDYRPGAADRARAGVSFPVWLESEALAAETPIFALRIKGEPKAYPVELVLHERVVNDELGGEELVLIGNPDSGAVRAYRRGAHEFAPTGQPARVADGAGNLWAVEEGGLVATSSPSKERLERLPGHIAFWFGWYAFYPQTEVYTGIPKTPSVEHDKDGSRRR